MGGISSGGGACAGASSHFGIWMVGDGRRWVTMDDDGGGGSERRVFGKQTHSRTNTRVAQMGG